MTSGVVRVLPIGIKMQDPGNPQSTSASEWMHEYTFQTRLCRDR